MVIVLDTPLEPMDAADSTFATDNFKAGELIGLGQGTLGDKAKDAKIVPTRSRPNQPTVDCPARPGLHAGLRHRRQGSQQDTATRTMRASSDHDITKATRKKAARRWRTACRSDPDINVVYTINEPAAAGAYEALKAVGKDDGNVLIVSVDGGCPGVKNVAGRRDRRDLAAISAEDGRRWRIEAIRIGQDAGNRTEGKASSTPARRSITAKPAEGVPSIDIEEGLKALLGLM